MSLEDQHDLQIAESSDEDTTVKTDVLPYSDHTDGRDQFRSEIYGSFWIDTTEFALPVGSIQEVVNEPDGFTPIPLAPVHLVGLFNLRGAIVPVVDLRILLDYPRLSDSECRKVAIIENDDLCIGLLFDDTGGVLYSEQSSRVNFENNAEGVSDMVVEGVLKFDDGARMVQLLDPFKVLQIQSVPRVAKTKTKTKADVPMHQKVGKRLSCISFQLGHTSCALDLRYVQEITDVPEIQKSPLAHGHIVGNINLRGHTMPVVDFRGVIGNEPPHAFNQAALSARKLLILSLPEGMVALLVYSIDSIIPYFESEVLSFAKIAIPRQDFVAGCLVTDDDEIVIMLDHGNLLRDPSLVKAAKSCQEIFPPDHQEQNEQETSECSSLDTYILFTVERHLGLDISNVSEVINRPEKLLNPPYLLPFIEGVLNLRGELITLINARELYQLPKGDETNQRVLIITMDGDKYGLVVDSIDEIVRANSKQIMDVPSFNKADSTARVISQDLSGCLRVPSRGPEGDPVMILSVASLVSRCAISHDSTHNQI